MKAEAYFIGNVPVARLAVMPRPRAGDWLADEITSWKESGVDVVVSLLDDSEIDELGLEEEGSLCQQADVEFLRFPIPDRGVPASQDELTVLVTKLVANLHKGRGVGIHCRMGVGRSALIAACVLVSLGQPTESVWSAIEDARGLSVPDTEVQHEWVVRWASSHTNNAEPFSSADDKAAANS